MNMSMSLTAVALIIMATVIYVTRVLGVWTIRQILITPRLHRALDATTGAVLVAIVAPAALTWRPRRPGSSDCWDRGS